MNPYTTATAVVGAAALIEATIFGITIGTFKILDEIHFRQTSRRYDVALAAYHSDKRIKPPEFGDFYYRRK